MIDVNDVIRFLEEATQSPPGAVSGETALAALDGWDSMGMVMFMGLVHDRAGVDLTVYDLRGCATTRSLAELIRSKDGLQ